MNSFLKVIITSIIQIHIIEEQIYSTIPFFHLQLLNEINLILIEQMLSLTYVLEILYLKLADQINSFF